MRCRVAKKRRNKHSKNEKIVCDLDLQKNDENYKPSKKEKYINVNVQRWGTEGPNPIPCSRNFVGWFPKIRKWTITMKSLMKFWNNVGNRFDFCGFDSLNTFQNFWPIFAFWIIIHFSIFVEPRRGFPCSDRSRTSVWVPGTHLKNQHAKIL